MEMLLMSVKEKLNEIVTDFIPTLVTTPEEIEKYLGKVALMYNYSLLNQIRASYSYYISTGREAERFATYKGWQKVGRQVKRGEKAHAVMLRPQTYKRTVVNPETEEEEEITWTKYIPFLVFSLDQTEGEPLQNNDLVHGESKVSLEDMMAKFKDEFDIKRSNTQLVRGSTNGEYIKVSEYLNENSAISTFIHEVAHNRCGHFDEHKDLDENVMELEAESVSFMVTSMLGLQNEKSRLYICGWNNLDAREVVQERASMLVNVAEEIFKEIMGI